MSDESIQDNPFSDDELAALRSLAKEDTAAALEYAAKIVQDYQAAGRIGGFILRVAKWLIVMTGFIAAMKSGLITFIAGK